MQRLLAVGAVLSLSLTARAADTYATYTNARFGYSVLYPTNLVSPRPEPDNGDGRVFKSRDAKATLTVWGENNVFNRTLSAQLDFSKREWAKDRARVTYAKVGRGFYVLSGFTGKEIFYEKTIPLRGGFATMLWQYPQSRKATLDAAVTRTTRAFVARSRGTVVIETRKRAPNRPAPTLAPRVTLRTPAPPKKTAPTADGGY